MPSWEQRSPSPSPPRPSPRRLGPYAGGGPVPTLGPGIPSWGAGGDPALASGDPRNAAATVLRAATPQPPGDAPLWGAAHDARDASTARHWHDSDSAAAPYRAPTGADAAAYVTGVPVDMRREVLEAAFGDQRRAGASVFLFLFATVPIRCGPVARVELLPIRFPRKGAFPTPRPPPRASAHGRAVGSRSALVFFAAAARRRRRTFFYFFFGGGEGPPSTPLEMIWGAPQAGLDAALAKSPLRVDGAALVAKPFNSADRPASAAALGRAERHALCSRGLVVRPPASAWSKGSLSTANGRRHVPRLPTPPTRPGLPRVRAGAGVRRGAAAPMRGLRRRLAMLAALGVSAPIDDGRSHVLRPSQVVRGVGRRRRA